MNSANFTLNYEQLESKNTIRFNLDGFAFRSKVKSNHGFAR